MRDVVVSHLATKIPGISLKMSAPHVSEAAASRFGGRFKDSLEC